MKHILFIHGGGGIAHEIGNQLAASLKRVLGSEYQINVPQMPKANAPEYALWRDEIAKQLAAFNDPVILVGHSLGASVLLKYLAEETAKQPVSGLFMVAAPFWGAEEWEVDDYKLSDGFAAALPENLPLFLYQSRDDEIVPFTHLALYANKLPQSTVREFDGRGHQFKDDLTEVAVDIAHLKG